MAARCRPAGSVCVDAAMWTLLLADRRKGHADVTLVIVAASAVSLLALALAQPVSEPASRPLMWIAVGASVGFLAGAGWVTLASTDVDGEAFMDRLIVLPVVGAIFGAVVAPVIGVVRVLRFRRRASGEPGQRDGL